MPNMELELGTLRSEVTCSTNQGSQVPQLFSLKTKQNKQTEKPKVKQTLWLNRKQVLLRLKEKSNRTFSEQMIPLFKKSYNKC